MASNEDYAKAKDWRRSHTSLTAQLWYMYENGICIDVLVRVKAIDGTEVVFNCHKLVLARLSENFLRLIENIDDDGNVEVVTVNLSTKDPQIFSVILRYAYLDKLELKSMKQALDVHRFSCEYGTVQIFKECENYISNNVNKHSVWDVLDYAPKQSMLMKWAKSTLGRQTKQCLQSENFLDCSQSTLLTLMKMQQLNMPSELDLVLAVIKWTRRRNKDQDLTPQISQKLLGPVLEQIRFLSLSAAEFSEHVAKSGLLNNSDCLAILVNMSAPGQMALSNHICKQMRPREKACQAKESSQKPTPTKQHEKEQQVVNAAKKVDPPPKNAAASKQDEIMKKTDLLFKQLQQGLSSMLNPVEKTRDHVVVERMLDPVCPFLTQTMKAPSEINISFQLSRAATLKSVCIETQVTETNKKTYKEALHIMVREMKKTENIAYQTYNGDARYGPDEELQVNFTSKVNRMNPGVWYTMRILLRSAGQYKLHFRPNLVVLEDLKVVFNKEESCARKPCPITKLILEV